MPTPPSRPVVRVAQRLLLPGLAVAAVLFGDGRVRAEAAALGGEALFRSVERYAAFGDHRTGTEGDRATTEWLAARLGRLGFAVELQRFELRQYFPDSHRVVVGAAAVEVFPHWLPPVSAVPIHAPLRELSAASLAGHIAYVDADAAGLWYKARPAALAERAAAKGARALIVAVDHPSGEIYVTNAAAPYLDTWLPIPTVVVAARNTAAIERALASGEAVEFSSTGRQREVAAHNVLARFPAQPIQGARTVVVSTPTSGWFQCAGERGTGVALWIGFAEWVAARPTTSLNWLFIGNSGHELAFMGAHESARRVPPPEEVRLWLHLGASIAARKWAEEGAELKPLDAVHDHNPLYADSRILGLAQEAFEGVPELDVFPGDQLQRSNSELGKVLADGYAGLGMVSSHRFFHTRGDTPRVTSAPLLAPYGEALELLGLKLRAESRD